LEAIGVGNAGAVDALRTKLIDLTGAAELTPVEEVVNVTYARLAQAPSALVVATVEDALCVPERPNVPGTTTEWPNWSIALPGLLEDVLADPRPAQLAATLDRSGRRRPGARQRREAPDAPGSSPDRP
jgi:4-alpha-glucanotransferase